LVTQAEKTTVPTDAENLYIQAINIKPTDLAAYTGLINTYKGDASFTVKEEEQLTQVINGNIDALRKTDGYASLAFEVGKLYWYYYDYGKSGEGDNQITRVKSSIQWFEDVITYGLKNSQNIKMAKTYGDIGKFHRDVTLHVEEASDKGLYSKYWADIKQLVTMIGSSQDESEIVKLELYKLTMYSIETYSRKFKADSIKEDDIKAVYDSVRKSTQNTETTTDKTKEMKDYIVNRFDGISAAINNAYRSN
jgi:serine/threonine-protein kinase